MKARFHALFIALAVFAGLPAGFAQPTLGIAPAGNQAVLSWPAWRTNYVLQSATSLALTNWVTASNAVIVTVNNSIVVTITNTSFARFFRLYSTNPPVAPAGAVLISSGGFTMGDTLDGEADAIPPVNVNVSDFAMDSNLVTVSQWSAVYAFGSLNGYSFDTPRTSGSGFYSNFPVQSVNWFDCVKWCNARSQQEGLFPVYYTDAAMTQVYTNGDYFPYADWSLNGYRLPTEAEWEKAARGGFSGLRFPWGDTISQSQANYYGEPYYFNCGGCFIYDLGPAGYNPLGIADAYSSYGVTYPPFTTPVGSFPANSFGLGLYDISGNVAVWCWDWYAGPPYPAGSPYLGGTDPRGGGPTPPYYYKVVRGGAWGIDAYYCRCASRSFSTGPSATSDYIGVRCVRTL